MHGNEHLRAEGRRGFGNRRRAPTASRLDLRTPGQLAGTQPDAAADRKELVLRVGFPDANPNVMIEGQEELPGKVNILPIRFPLWAAPCAW